MFTRTTKAKTRSEPLAAARVREAASGLFLHHAAQYFALPVRLVHRPTLHGDAVCLNHFRPAGAIDVLLTFRLRRLQLARRARAVRAAAREMVIVEHRHDAR